MTPPKKSQKSVWRIVFIGLGIIVLLMIGFALYVQSQWKPMIKDKIGSAIINASDSLYRINYTDIDLNILTGTVSLHQAQLIPDSMRYERLKLIKRAPTHLFRIKTKRLQINRAQLLNAYFKQTIKLKRIALVEPKIWMYYTKVGRMVDTNTTQKSLFEMIAPSLKFIQVGEVRIQDADFEYYNGKRLANKINHLNIAINDILIDSAAQFDTTRVGYAKAIAFNLGNYESLSKDKRYKIRLDSVNGNIITKQVLVKGFKLIPQLSDLAFSRQFKVQKDRYDLSFEQLKISNLDFIHLNQTGEIRARKIELGPGKVAVFLNRELPPPPIDKGRNFPHRALARLDINTKVDSLVLNQIQIAYTEYNPDTKAKGTLLLGNLKGSLLNLTNDSLSLTQNHYAKANLTASLMNQGNLNVQINFNLTDPLAAFSYAGSIRNYNLTHLNKLAKPLGQVEVESGLVKDLNFSMQGNTRGAYGRVNFLYTDLKANLTKIDAEGKTKKKGLLSFVANTVLIKDSNPLPGKETRTANVQWARVPQASFFNLMWKSIFLGIREIVGIGMIPMKNPGDKD
ncbi:MAG: DUF748 domain-containing protein [Pedobacter sp.]|nr:MAG: DUF748 domain-containing protein [Pedobacter sp.]